MANKQTPWLITINHPTVTTTTTTTTTIMATPL